MKFERYTRYEPVTITQRKEAAYARKLEKERARYPLFSDHVASEQRSFDAEIVRRHSAQHAAEAGMRAFHAKTWKKSRTHYFTLPEDVQAQVRVQWNSWVGPRTSTYFAWLVDTLSGEQAKRIAQATRERKELIGRLVDAGRVAAPALF